jgi:hypothetical protein
MLSVGHQYRITPAALQAFLGGTVTQNTVQLGFQGGPGDAKAQAKSQGRSTKCMAARAAD